MADMTRTPRRQLLAAAVGSLLPASQSLAAHELRRLAHGLPFVPLAVAVTGQELVVGGPSGLWVVDLKTGIPARGRWQDQDAPVFSVTADSGLIATTGRFGLRVYDAAGGQPKWSNTAVTSVSAISLAGDGAIIATDPIAGHLLRIDRDQTSLVAGGLARPVGVFVEGDEDAWVTEYAAGRVLYVGLKARTVRPLVFALNGPTAVAKLNTGNLAVMEPNFGRILTVDPKTGERTPLAGGLALSLDDLDLPPDTAGGLAATDKDVVYAACPGDRSIVGIVPELRRERDKT